MTSKSTIYFPDGTVDVKTHDKEKGFDLAREWIGGYIERLHPDYLLGAKYEDRQRQIFVNEDGNILQLERNRNPEFIKRFGHIPLCGIIVVAEDWKMT